MLNFVNGLLLFATGYWSLATVCLLVLFEMLDRERPAPSLEADLAEGNATGDSGPTEHADAPPAEGCAIAEEAQPVAAEAPLVTTEGNPAGTGEQAPAAAPPLCCPNLFAVSGLSAPQAQSSP